MVQFLPLPLAKRRDLEFLNGAGFRCSVFQNHPQPRSGRNVVPDSLHEATGIVLGQPPVQPNIDGAFFQGSRPLCVLGEHRHAFVGILDRGEGRHGKDLRLDGHVAPVVVGVEIVSVQIRVKDSPVLNIGRREPCKPLLVVRLQVGLVNEIDGNAGTETVVPAQFPFDDRSLPVLRDNNAAAVPNVQVELVVGSQLSGKEQVGATLSHFPHHPFLADWMNHQSRGRIELDPRRWLPMPTVTVARWWEWPGCFTGQGGVGDRSSRNHRRPAGLFRFQWIVDNDFRFRAGGFVFVFALFAQILAQSTGGRRLPAGLEPQLLGHGRGSPVIVLVVGD
mmetsp:Transcript_12389/g.26147  ORF Transcript_12389/g.26147 Transcript_12389/m.26147 type:complete len:334 (-) Transcript_12389:275-1276(-)